MALDSPQRVRDDLKALETLAYQPVDSAAELERHLDAVRQRLVGVDLAAFDIAAMRAAAPELMRGIFAVSLALRGRLPEWHYQGIMSRQVQKALRDTFSACRYAGDMLGELQHGHSRLAEGETTLSGFSGGGLATLVNPAFAGGDKLAFQEGDVLLMRGMRHNSAAIARIGDIDSQFSHVGVVHIDEAGQPWIVESLIEDGAVIQPLEYTLSHELARAMLFRHRDAALAARAARFIHARVARSRKSFLLRIHYDFSMRLSGYRRLFCSKLVRQAYDAASRGRLKLPTFGTRLDMQNRDFFRRIGVTATETFAPGDMELEPEFDLVAEWRDYRATSGLRLQDVLMDKLFEWMDVHGYRFRETFAIRLVSLFGRLSSHLSDETKGMLADVIPKIPINMRRRTIAAVAMLHKTAEPLFEELKRLEAEQIARHGRQLHPREVRELLEGVRQRMGRQIGYLVAKA